MPTTEITFMSTNNNLTLKIFYENIMDIIFFYFPKNNVNKSSNKSTNIRGVNTLNCYFITQATKNSLHPSL